MTEIILGLLSLIIRSFSLELFLTLYKYINECIEEANYVEEICEQLDNWNVAMFGITCFSANEVQNQEPQ